MTQPALFPFVDLNPSRPENGLMPYSPLLLAANQRTLQVQGRYHVSRKRSAIELVSAQ